jgi:hypothetical protein
VLACTILGNDDSALLVTLTDDLKKQIGAVFIDGEVAQFIDEQ